MVCTILGCGGSSGVPEIGCKCYTCSSCNPKNKRLRSSIHIKSSTTSIIVDTSVDFRQQALNNNIEHIDAVLYTHDHGDHICGIDDIKSFTKNGKIIPAFFDQKTSKTLITRFPYIFNQFSKLYPARLQANIIDYDIPFFVNELKILPFRQIHGSIYSAGFRFGDLAYSTDLNDLSHNSLNILDGIKIWVLDCLRYATAPTHLTVEKMLALVKKVKPQNVILTHMAHDIEYDEIKHMLPANIIPGFDGMQLEFMGFT